MTSSSARRLASGLLTAVSVAYSVIGLLYFLTGGLVSGLVASAAMAGVVGLHHVNTRAALCGGLPPLFPLTALLQAVVTYVPDFLLPGGYSAVAAPMLAGTALVFLPLRWGSLAVGLMMVYMWAGLAHALPLVVMLFYLMTVPITGALGYALVRFVRVSADLEEARAELAEAAVLKERMRISRDLHDGLGHSLTAIALKGDLAARLIPRDPAAARDEVGELVKVAREAAQDVRQVARGYRPLSLTGEVDRAVALLESSGVSCQAHLTGTPLPRHADEALAWAVREAATNILRHTRATTCTITTSARAGRLRLEVANDGVTLPPLATGKPNGKASPADAAEAEVEAEPTGGAAPGRVGAGGGLV
ncbi:sensor histidine kinase, partial [Nonomuraea sp. SBT364]|uniref:sensor histidine kinase n=1 Tax=Nonomuraea sp. SBT364 TaxID=1580530 RepID=UPI0018CCEFE4